MEIIKGGVAVDDRGSVRFVNGFDFHNIKRFYQVENHEQGFIRAWHGHKLEDKYVYCVKGSVLVGAVPFEGEADDCERFVLTSDNPSILYIPKGHYNGFMNLTDGAILQFFSTVTMDVAAGDDYRLPYNTWDIWDIERR